MSRQKDVMMMLLYTMIKTVTFDSVNKNKHIRQTIQA